MTGAFNDGEPAARRSGEGGPTEPTAPPEAHSAPGLAARAADLEAIRSAVADAAGVSAGLWLSYLFVLFYLLVAAGSVTHRDLFFANPIKLPFLSVELPLEGFFWLGPPCFSLCTPTCCCTLFCSPARFVIPRAHARACSDGIVFRVGVNLGDIIIGED